MKYLITLFSCLFVIKTSFTQTATELFNKGDSLYGAKDYKNAALNYASAIRTKGKDAMVFRYSYCSAMWSLAGEPDSAFYYLNLVAGSDQVSLGDANGIKNDNDLASIKKDKRWQRIVDRITEQATKNSFPQEEFIYGRKDGMGLTMVWIKPKLRSNGKAIIHVQSGAWVSGHDGIEVPTGLAQMYLNKGYTVFAVSHGSQPRYAIPDAVADIKRAIRYIRYNAAKFGINPAHIGITGFSSGGHLSLTVAMAEDKIDSAAVDPVNRVSSRVQAAAVLYPPTDFLNWGQAGFDILHDKNLMKNVRLTEAFNFRIYDRRARSLNIITDSISKYKIIKEISPIYAVSPGDPPVFIIHGDADPLVPLQQSESYMAKLKEAGVANKLIIKKAAGHSIEDMLPELRQFADWFDKHLQ